MQHTILMPSVYVSHIGTEASMKSWEQNIWRFCCLKEERKKWAKLTHCQKWPRQEHTSKIGKWGGTMDRRNAIFDPFLKEELSCDSGHIWTFNVFMSCDLCFPLTDPNPICHSSSVFPLSPPPQLCIISIHPSLCADSASCLQLPPPSFCPTGSQPASLKASPVKAPGGHNSLAYHYQTLSSSYSMRHVHKGTYYLNRRTR